MSALRQIAAEMIALADEADAGDQPDPHALRIIARKVGAQAELYERGLGE